jgi:hypothetical protein
MSGLARETRLQIMLGEAELAAIDDYRFEQRIPSRAAAVRQLLRLGLLALKEPKSGRRSAGYGVLANSGGSEDDASAEG